MALKPEISQFTEFTSALTLLVSQMIVTLKVWIHISNLKQSLKQSLSPEWRAPPSRCRCLDGGGCARVASSSGRPSPLTSSLSFPSWPPHSSLLLPGRSLPPFSHHCSCQRGSVVRYIHTCNFVKLVCGYQINFLFLLCCNYFTDKEGDGNIWSRCRYITTVLRIWCAKWIYEYMICKL